MSYGHGTPGYHYREVNEPLIFTISTVHHEDGTWGYDNPASKWPGRGTVCVRPLERRFYTWQSAVDALTDWLWED